jgi:hypothetical protein
MNARVKMNENKLELTISQKMISHYRFFFNATAMAFSASGPITA